MTIFILLLAITGILFIATVKKENNKDESEGYIMLLMFFLAPVWIIFLVCWIIPVKVITILAVFGFIVWIASK